MAYSEPSQAEGECLVWDRWEQLFSAKQPIDRPMTLALRMSLTGPTGETHVVPGFWDGGRRWKVRFCPQTAGRWHFQTQSQPPIAGLHRQTGTFTALPANDSSNRFLQHSALQVSTCGHHLEHADGTPFFWLADTAWSGPLKSSSEEWSTYLADRTAKGFTGVQFVTTPWRGAPTDRSGQTAYQSGETLTIQPAFFQRLDQRINAINDAGLLAIPVLLWALGDVVTVPGKLPETQAVQLARYITARYGAHHTVWFLTGDASFSTAWRNRWKALGRSVLRHGARDVAWSLRRAIRGTDPVAYWSRVGRAVFAEPTHTTLASAHPQARQWEVEQLRQESWYDLIAYQSGHDGDSKTLQWIHSGPPARSESEAPALPVINAEPGYEGIVATSHGGRHTAADIRQQAYYSLLYTPPAGVSYGAHGLWSWETELGVPHNHPHTGVARPWSEALHLPGSTHLQYLTELFNRVTWHRLRPDRDLVVSSSSPDSQGQVAAARTRTGDLAILYLPQGGRVDLRTDKLSPDAGLHWFNPRTGRHRAAKSLASEPLRSPDAQDWVLVHKG